MIRLALAEGMTTQQLGEAARDLAPTGVQVSGRVLTGAAVQLS